MIVVVTGGRNYTNYNRICQALDEETGPDGPRFILHGACRGADLLAAQWASFNEVDEIRMPARWSEGLTAGPERNRRMLKFARELVVPGERLVLVAFPGGYGTASCVREAKWLDIEVKEIKE